MASADPVREFWHVREVRTVWQDAVCGCEAVVESEDGVDICASFYELRDGQIRAGTEYWIRKNSERRPAWRKPYSELLG